jgi:hypothetical protein
MTLGAVMAEVIGYMVGIIGSIVVIGVATVTVMRSVVIATGMTGNAGQRYMGSS